jgi:hypothetical protein
MIDSNSLHTFLCVLAFVAVVLGGLGAILGGISVVLHAIAQRTKSAVPGTLAADVDAVRDELDKLSALVHEIVLPSASTSAASPIGASDVTITSPQTPSAKAAQAGSVRTLIIAALAALGIVSATALLTGCATLRSSTAAGVGAFIACEDPAIAKTAADLEPLAQAVVSKWIGGSPAALDTKGLKGDIAGIKDHAQQCAITAAADAVAMAATATPTTADPAAPFQAHALVTSPSARAGDQVRASFTSLRSELGWAPVHLANGRVM